MSRVTVKALVSYPVKSCAGIWHTAVQMTKRGLLNDRAFMVVDPEWRMMTQREHPRMALIAVSESGPYVGVLQFPGAPSIATFLLQETPGFDERMVTLRSHTLRAFDQGDEVAEWLTLHLGTPCRLVRMADDEVRKTKQGDGEAAFSDGYPILGTSDESLADLNGRMAGPVPHDRFRANIIFEGGEAFEEDSWRHIRIVGSGVELVGTTLCARCGIPQVNQSTAAIGKEPARTLSTYRKAEHLAHLHAALKLPYPKNVYFGRNFVVVGTGTVVVGMEVEVLETD